MTGTIHTELLLLKQNYYRTVLSYITLFSEYVIIHLHQNYDPFWMPTNVYEIKQPQYKKLHRIMKNEAMA